MKQLYVIVDTRNYCGNAVFFWKTGFAGYTLDPDEALKVESFKGRPTDKLVPVEVIEKVRRSFVDMQDLKEYL
jgi:hypothetical protein